MWVLVITFIIISVSSRSSCGCKQTLLKFPSTTLVLVSSIYVYLQLLNRLANYKKLYTNKVSNLQRIIYSIYILCSFYRVVQHFFKIHKIKNVAPNTRFRFSPSSDFLDSFRSGFIFSLVPLIPLFH